MAGIWAKRAVVSDRSITPSEPPARLWIRRESIWSASCRFPLHKLHLAQFSDDGENASGRTKGEIAANKEESSITARADGNKVFSGRQTSLKMSRVATHARGASETALESQLQSHCQFCGSRRKGSRLKVSAKSRWIYIVADDAATRREKARTALDAIDPALSDAHPYLFGLLGLARPHWQKPKAWQTLAGMWP
jgi:hypothetical protein